MKSKKRPLNFAAPTFAEEAPGPAVAEEALALGMPPVPAETDQPVTFSSKGGLQKAGAQAPPQPAKLSTPPKQGGGFIYFLAIAATVLWVGGLTAYTLGFRSHVGPFEDEPFAILILALLGLAPVGLIWIGAFALRQGVRLLAEVRRLQDLSDQMIAPTALAASRAGGVIKAIRQEIEGVTRAADKAQQELAHLHNQLARESDRLIEMASGSARDAMGLVQSLGRERQEFGVLSTKLEGRVGEIGDAIGRHARMVAEASDLAQAQVQEAEAGLAARAADLAAAAGEASEAARMAGDDLARQAARLEQAGVTVREQSQIVEEGLGQQRAALVTLAHGMRSDHEDMSVHFETQRAQLSEMMLQAEQGTLQVGEVAMRSAQTLRDLIIAAAEQMRDMGDQAQTERDLLSGSALQSLGAFSEAAAFERRALEEETRRAIEDLTVAAESAHKAAERAGAAARVKVEQLSEAAFVAGQKADATFEVRLNEARGLIERSVHLVDEAGSRSAQKLEQGVGAAYTALDVLQRSLAEIEARASTLPTQAAASGEEIHAAFETANQTLLEGARKAAAELEGIDSAFQERVKRNYEMLSEAVRLMGVLGGGAATRASGPAVVTRPPPTPPPSLPLRQRETPPPAPAPPPPEPKAEPKPEPRPEPDEEDLDLRPRLRLKPAAPEDDDDEAEEPMFRPAPLRPSTPGGPDPDWTWNELVSALDENDADDLEMERVLLAEIDGLGIDAPALIPTRRLDDIAIAYESGDAPAARELVHRLAPAAVRKLGRRVLTDKLIRAQADRFIDRYHGLIRGAVRRGDDGLTAVKLLGSAAGRAFLLLDAAVGDRG
jgi:hypothetical protein